jgi:hypothetical protein
MQAILECRQVLEEGKTLLTTRMKHIVLADLHGWDFVSEYKHDPIAEDDSDEKRIKKVIKTVDVQREKKKAEKAKKFNRFKFDSGRRFGVKASTNDSSFVSTSTCFLCGRPGHFWRSCFLYRSRSGPAANTPHTTFGGFTPRATSPQLLLQPPNFVPPAMQLK